MSGTGVIGNQRQLPSEPDEPAADQPTEPAGAGLARLDMAQVLRWAAEGYEWPEIEDRVRRMINGTER